jgi:hypothetical protein
MASLINIQSSLRQAGRKHARPGQPDALTVREVDALVSRLLDEIDIPFTSVGKRVLGQLTDLKKVLASDYREAPGLPSKPLLRDLSHIVEHEIRSHADIWKHWDEPQSFNHLVRLFGPREIEVRAEPYRRGAGLSLRGFFCRTKVSNKDKFVIFLNTAHHPGAVAATFGHELGHYMYGSLAGETAPMTAFMEGTFAAHLQEEHELFADSLVALAAYSREQIRQIGRMDKIEPGNSETFFKRIQKAYEAIGERYRLDLRKDHMTAPWRVCYLTSMIHFFKLRCALLEAVEL